MELNNFTKEELNIIEKLLTSATIIKNTYDKLYNLEITNKKETNDYNQILNELNEQIKNETNLYKQLNSPTEKNFKIIELLTQSPNFKKTNDIHSIINQDESDIINRRIINNIIYNLIINRNYYNINSNNEISNLLKNLGINNDNEQIIKEINNLSQIEITINEDIYMIFLSILQETSEQPKYSSNELKKTIYKTCYINKNIENIILKQKFNISKQIYTSSKLFNDILTTNNKTFKIITNLIVKSQINTHIIELLKITDNKYNNHIEKNKAIINQCYIRSLLTFLTDDDIYKLNDEFHHLIDSPQYLSKKDNNQISEKIIINCFKNINHDRAKKLTIFFNKNN